MHQQRNQHPGSNFSHRPSPQQGSRSGHGYHSQGQSQYGWALSQQRPAQQGMFTHAPSQQRQVQQGMFRHAPSQQRPAQQGMFNRVPSQQQPVQPGMFGRVPPQQRPAQQGMFNPQHRGGSFGQQQGRGGLLSKLLGKSKPVPSSPISMFSLPSAPKAETGGLLASLKNPGSISSFLSNTQKVLQAAEAVGPMFQQYGPLVKNFPALWKLYKGLKDSDSVSSEEPESEDNNDTLGTSEYETENFEDDEDLEDYDMEKIKVHEKKPSSSVKNHEKRNSVPRLFF